MKLRRTPEAQADLEAIIDYIAEEQQNPDAAWDVLQCIEQAFDRIQRQPYIGRENRRYNTRELTIAGLPLCVVYQITDDAIEVLMIFHESKDPNKKYK